jgi:hypothetical protein
MSGRERSVLGALPVAHGRHGRASPVKPVVSASDRRVLGNLSNQREQLAGKKTSGGRPGVTTKKGSGPEFVIQIDKKIPVKERIEVPVVVQKEENFPDFEDEIDFGDLKVEELSDDLDDEDVEVFHGGIVTKSPFAPDPAVLGNDESDDDDWEPPACIKGRFGIDDRFLMTKEQLQLDKDIEEMGKLLQSQDVSELFAELDQSPPATPKPQLPELEGIEEVDLAGIEISVISDEEFDDAKDIDQ